MNCKNCAAPLKSDQRECPYCGTENPGFIVRDTGIRVTLEKRRPDDVRICAFAKIPVEVVRFSGYDVNEIIRERLVKEIAEEIVKKKGYVMTTCDDIFDNTIAFKLEVTVRDYTLMEKSNE